MEKTSLKEITIKLPGNLIESISNKEIINMLIDKALNKTEYYKSKCKEMEEKYGSTFTKFRKKIEKSEKECFTEWDDLILWEGYELSYKEWKSKYKELKFCRK